MRTSKPGKLMERAENSTTTAHDAQAELERLKLELRREHDMYLRALADFDNYRGAWIGSEPKPPIEESAR